jgi:DNA helicase-2/ATP-dependent DNA helicase PcrA
MNIFEELNEAQIAAVKVINGPIMVIAGAGSGKTKVLTHRIAHLIQNDIDPFNILALTFTNKAAQEMKQRISEMVGYDQSRNIWMGTFHSVFARILRTEHEKIGYSSNFTIYDTQDSKSVLKSIVKEKNLDEKLYKPGILYNRISSAKNSLISYENYKNNSEITLADKSSGRPKIGEIYEAYQKKCFKASAMDFDDLLFKTNILLKNHPEVLYKYQEKFKYILVDEYQDTNHSQYVIIKSLAARFENICVVGDDAQSIYSFRGANIQNILNFKRDYPDYQLFKLEQNYRSTQNIVEAANSVIRINKEQIKKSVWTANGQGDKIKVFKSFSDNEEGKIVANNIFEKSQNEKSAFFKFCYSLSNKRSIKGI